MLYANTTPINQTYAYLDETGTRSNRVGSLTTKINNTTYQTQTYTYDANGNITSVTSGGKTTRYTYDAANQLIREDNEAENRTWVYTYDLGGNITSKTTYTYTLDAPTTVLDTAAYSYYTGTWKDLLVGYDGLTINSDTIGNPTEVKQGDTVIRRYTWEHGRQLASLTENGTTWNYTYNSTGLRTERTNGTKTYTYTYNGSQLTYMTVDGHTLWFSYDAHGPMYVKYDGSTYQYITNLQGDIIAIANSQGNVVVEYTYDAWGNILSTSGSMASTLGAYNPLRYRSYVYDTETELYYLESRYYSPEMGRFINADGLVSTGQGLLGYNMFAYCLNNPVVHLDATGTRVVGIGFQGEIQGGGTSTGIEIVVYFDEEVCNGNDFLVVVYFYGGYEVSPSQLKGILKSADAVLLAYSVESAYQRAFTPDCDPMEAMKQFLFETSIVEALRGCLSGVSLSGAVFVIDGKEGVFTDPEHYSGEFGTWSYSVDIGTNAASLFVAESQSCTAVGIKTSKKIPGFISGKSMFIPLEITYSRSYYSDPIILLRGDL